MGFAESLCTTCFSASLLLLRFFFLIISNLNSSCCCFQLLWFLFMCVPLSCDKSSSSFSPSLPTRYKRLQREARQPLNCKPKLPQLLCILAQIICMCVPITYSSLIPVLVAFCWTPISLSQGNRTGALQVQPMDSRQKWLMALPQGCVPVSWPGCCPPYPTDCIAS